MEKEHLEELKGKKRFLKALGEVLKTSKRMSIADIDLEVYLIDGYVMEYVVITFDGGAISVANASGNSDSANLRQVAKMVNGGYYDEVEMYLEIKDKYVKVEVK